MSRRVNADDGNDMNEQYSVSNPREYDSQAQSSFYKVNTYNLKQYQGSADVRADKLESADNPAIRTSKYDFLILLCCCSSLFSIILGSAAVILAIRSKRNNGFSTAGSKMKI